MEKLVLKGGNKLNGTVTVSNAKNAYLPIIAAVLLNENKVILKNIPDLRDIRTIFKLLENLGVTITNIKDRDFEFDPSHITSYEATYDLVKTMRASICVLGPLLARFQTAKVSLPGGCAIGTRPIDLHLKNLEKMGAKINVTGGYVEASVDQLQAVNLILDFPSVGATENLMMAAVFTKGITKIENAALEPEIDDLANFLNAMGAKVTGIGTKVISIEGVDKLKACEYEAIGDRIEAGTYIMAALATEGEVKVKGFNPDHIDFVLEKLKSMGANLERGEDFVQVFPSKLTATKIETAPYPGFPTDLQAQMLALCLKAEGTSIITEKIFENRFMHVPELQRLGADIVLEGHTALIKKSDNLKGAPVMCTDLRASAALVIAGLISSGSTEVLRIYHLERGYENLFEKLSDINADIVKVKTEPFSDH